MFGLLGRQRAPEGPVTFDFEIEIGRSAAEVYALLDWSDPRNAKRQLGNEVMEVEGEPGRFVMRMTAMPELTFDFLVTEAVPNETYAFACEINPRAGRLLHCTERYEIEPTTESSCLLRLVTVATFVPSLRVKEFSHELALMAGANHNALAKLKIQAEQGVDAVRAVEHRTFV